MTQYEEFTKKIGLTILLTLLTVALATSVVFATDVYLLMFLAILSGVLFAHLSERLGRWCPMSYRMNLSIVVTVIVAASIATVAFFGWRIEQQVQKTSEQLDKSYDEVVAWLEKHPTAKTAFQRLPFAEDLMPDLSGSSESEPKSQPSNESFKQGTPDPGRADNDSATDSDSEIASTGWSNVGTVKPVSGSVFAALGKMFSTTMGASMNVAFVSFVGVFLAIKPDFYRDNFARLFPHSSRPRVTEILNKLGDTLFDWLQGRAATMAITGVGTAIVLWLLGVPLALTLGGITGVLTFIPTIGAFMALVLSMMVALSQGPTTVLWVIVLYASLQFIESNVITPLIQQHQTSVPPPILLSAQLMMGVLTGFLGVIVSTPLAASVIVLVKEAYLVDVLQDDAV